MRMSDHDYELYVEKKKARAEGLAEGHAEGRAEGHAEGLAEGIAEGRNDERAAVALDMLADNEPLEKIIKYSHLSMEKVLELKDNRGTFTAK